MSKKIFSLKNILTFCFVVACSALIVFYALVYLENQEPNSPVTKEHVVTASPEVVTTPPQLVLTNKLFFAELDQEVLGLSKQERSGRWSNGEKVSLNFKLEKVEPLTLKFDLKPFLTDKRPYQQAIVIMNGKQKAIWRFEKEKPQPFTGLLIDAEEIPEDKILSLEFLIDNPVSPKEIGYNNDSRKLAIRFISVEIEPQQIQKGETYEGLEKANKYQRTLN